MIEAAGGFEGQGPVPIFTVSNETLTVEAIFTNLSVFGHQEGLFKRRLISRDRVPTAQATGTDRDRSSNIDCNGSYDGESQLMREAGINDPSQVTYVSDLTAATRNLSGEPWIKVPEESALLVYDPDGLVRLGSMTNGFHRFLPGMRRRSLLAIFQSPVPVIKSTKPTSKFSTEYSHALPSADWTGIKLSF